MVDETTDIAQVLAAIETLGEHEAAFIQRSESAATVDICLGSLSSIETLDQIPLEGNQEVIALVPFRQISERGYCAIDDGEPLQVLVARQIWHIPLNDILADLPHSAPTISQIHPSLDDAAYAKVAQTIIETEIGRGEGANFVIRRDFEAHTDASMISTVLAWLRRLLIEEAGAYWTYAFITRDLSLVGASPERHVSIENGQVLMNPISGTLRHGDTVPDAEELVAFLADVKESEELVMVVDEELKMMSSICPEGGVMRGPYLKPMAKLTHTEYLLEGYSELDPREVLRRTMFAPTVTGSPMENACRVIARHEESGRGYYSGVIARFSAHARGWNLDAPIIIRTAAIDRKGNVKVSAGATLVRHSDPFSEAWETSAKAAGVLTALGASGGESSRTHVLPGSGNPAVQADQVKAALQERNRFLAPFWRDNYGEVNDSAAGAFPGQIRGTALVVDCGDEFSVMLAHQLRRLGMAVDVEKWDQVSGVDRYDLLVAGPGPGDPLEEADPRVVRIRSLLGERLSSRRPLLAVCFSHQVLSDLAGLDLVALPEPRQGIALPTKLISETGIVGYYNTFTALGTDGETTPRLGLTIRAEEPSGYVQGLIGPQVASVQGHLESVLSYDGFQMLFDLVTHTMSER